jgi:penicillin-binding protein 1A
MIKRIFRLIFIQPLLWFWNLSRIKKLLYGGLMTLAGITLLLSLPIWLYVAVKSGAFGKMPSDQELLNIKNYQASEVYTADSVLMGRFFVENRSDVTFEQVNKSVFDAIISIEDARFYEHKGVDTRSLLRVLFKSVLLGKKSGGGGSTLSQQLVKNLFGRKRYGLLTMPVNKIKEAIIANQIETLYSKKDILVLYLNTVSFGEDTYGIKTAAERFFSTTPDKIAPEQAASLAAMLKSPTAYNPRTHPEQNLERRNLVLSQMAEHGYLTKNDKDQLQKSPLALDYHREAHHEGIAPYFREKIRLELEKWLQEHPNEQGKTYDLNTDGLKIYTTIHSRIQQYAEEAVKTHLAKAQSALQNDLRANRFFVKNQALLLDAIKKTPRYIALSAQGLTQEAIIKELQKTAKTTVFTQTGEKEMDISPLDSVKMMLTTLQTGFLVSNPKNGQLLAYVGGASFEYFPFDHVMAKRQVGSTFKPIVYAAALQNGTQPCDFIPNQKITYTQYENWTPQNTEDSYGGKYSVAGAFANSINTISVQLCMNVGIKKVVELARTLGIQNNLPEKPSIALGTADLTLWELLGAYTPFANNGIKTEFTYLLSVQTSQGKIIYSPAPNTGKQVLAPEIAQDITNMMRNVTSKGTGYELREKYKFTGDIAGKTGTTQDHRDAWFVGYTANLLAGVWVGADNPAVHFSNLVQGKGSRAAMPIWAGLYSRLLKDKELRYLIANFPFENTIDCEMQKEDGLLEKLFRRKEKNSNASGLEDEPKKEKKRFRLFGRKKEK